MPKEIDTGYNTEQVLKRIMMALAHLVEDVRRYIRLTANSLSAHVDYEELRRLSNN